MPQKNPEIAARDARRGSEFRQRLLDYQADLVRSGKRKISAYTLAKMTRIDRSTLTRILNGERDATTDQILSIAAALQAPQLIPGDMQAVVESTGATTRKKTPTAERSDPLDRMPPNVADFVRRMEEGKRYDQDVLDSIRSGARRPELQFATEQDLIDLAEWTKAIVERAKAWGPAR